MLRVRSAKDHPAADPGRRQSKPSHLVKTMKKTLLTNVRIFTPEHQFVPGSLLVTENRIERIWLSQQDDANKLENDSKYDAETLDCGGAYCFPGLLDIHFHGCMGADVCDGTPEALQTIAAYEASIGVTAICPATMTLPAEDLEQVLENMARFRRETLGVTDVSECAADEMERAADGIERAADGLERAANRSERAADVSEYTANASYADLVGINMEGPFISPKKCGAQDPKNIVKADTALFDRFWKASQGLISFIGLAPEENDPADVQNFVRHVTQTGAKVSLCHTDAGYDAAKNAVDAGACHAVHLYNAMRGFTHREPGTVGTVFDSPSVDAELICDGIHVHPASVRATFAAIGEERIVLISDSMRATGMGDGEYTLGGLPVTVQGKTAVLSEAAGEGAGSLAGSVTTLPDMVRTVVKEMGIPLETAIRCATENAAKSIGVSDRYGVLAEGRQADLVLWNEALETVGVMHRGTWVGSVLFS